MTLSDDLNAIADEIERRGWCQGVEQDIDGKVCIVGAYNVSKDQHPRFNGWEPKNAIHAISDYLGGERAVDFNDADDRTQDQVIQMLRDCAIKNQPDTMWG